MIFSLVWRKGVFLAGTAVTIERGQSLECGRLAAAVMVVFIHARFPGNFGRAADCLARFAVPFFFALSGFFACRAGEGQLLRRLRRVLLLAIGSSAGYLVFHCLLALAAGGSPRDALAGLNLRSLGEMLLFQASPFAGHLWYLNALCLCYGLLWLHVRRRGTGGGAGLYALGGGLLGLYLLLEPVGGLLGWDIPYIWVRNGWLLGFPLFLLGHFLGSHPRKLSTVAAWALIALGAGLSLTQWFLLRPVELPLGMLLVTPALLLFLADRPGTRLPKALTAKFGPLSTALYLLHPAVLELCEAFAPLSREPWLTPLAVLALSLVPAALWAWAGEKRRA